MAASTDRTEMIMQRFRPVLLTLAEAMISPALRSDLEASDLVQQTLLEAHGSAGLLASLGEGQLFAWLRKALKHNVLDAIKRLHRLRRDGKRTLRIPEYEESFFGLEQLFIAGDTSPSQGAIRNEQITTMLSAIQELSHNQRLAIILKHLRGHSQSEVAAILQLSETATAGLLHRGRQQLLKCLKDAGHE